MGCDIHAHWEVKINEEWLHYDQPHIKRDYRLFAKMAGVRAENNAIDPISKPRGLPKDTTQIVQFHSNYMDTDGHSHSWLGVKEIEELYRFWIEDLKEKDMEWNMQFDYLFGNGWDSFKECPESYPKGLQDFRLVFWFDN